MSSGLPRGRERQGAVQGDNERP